jgi:hypothetical protein
MHGASTEEWLALRSIDDDFAAIYVYDHESRTAWSATSSEVPFFVSFTLSRHKKYRFCNRSIPDIQAVNDATLSFANRLQWRQALATQARSRHAGMLSVPSLIATPPCEGCPPELKAWTSWLRTTIAATCRKTASKYGGKVGVNRLLIDKVAVKWLRDCGYVALPTDKDGAFCLVSRDVVASLHQEVLQREVYEQVQEQPNFKDIRKEYYTLCKEVSKAEGDNELLRVLSRSLRGTEQRHFVRSLSLTVKTHKSPVAVRNLHTGPHQAFAGLSLWLARHLKTQLRDKRHLINSSDAVIQQVNGKTFSKNCRLYKIDLKDFFNSGSFDDIISFGTKGFTSSLRQVAQKVVKFLLVHQYVQSRYLDDALFRVRVGTGMGLIHSGELADAVFYHMAESPLLAQPRSLQFFGVECFTRFKDDMLFIAQGRLEHGMLDLIQQVRQHARGFTLVCEAISESTMPYLDLEVSLHRTADFAVAKWRPYFKPTSLHKPLCHRSAHPLSVHITWPFNELNRLARHCCDNATYREVRATFVNKFSRSHAPAALISRLRNHVPPTHAIVEKKQRDGCLWLVLPYHPVWARAPLTKVLEEFRTNPLCKQVWGEAANEEPPVVRIAWKNFLPSLMQMVQKGATRTSTN